MTQEVGNYHLKRLPVISITTLFAEGVQRGSAGERCCRNEGPDHTWSSAPLHSPSLHRWSCLEPLGSEHLPRTVPLLHTFTARSAATPAPSSLSSPLWFMALFFFMMGLSYSSSVLKLAFLFHGNI